MITLNIKHTLMTNEIGLLTGFVGCCVWDLQLKTHMVLHRGSAGMGFSSTTIDFGGGSICITSASTTLFVFLRWLPSKTWLVIPNWAVGQLSYNPLWPPDLHAPWCTVPWTSRGHWWSGDDMTPRSSSHLLPRMVVKGSAESTTWKRVYTCISPTCTNNWICPIGHTCSPEKL